jgi:hypothetical protein
MFLSHRQNAKQNRSIKTTSQSVENVENFNYCGWTMTDESIVHKKIEKKINSWNALLRFYPESVLPFTTEAYEHINMSSFYFNQTI